MMVPDGGTRKSSCSLVHLWFVAWLASLSLLLGCSGSTDFEKADILKGQYSLAASCRDVDAGILQSQPDGAVDQCCQACNHVAVSIQNKTTAYWEAAKSRRWMLVAVSGIMAFLVGVGWYFLVTKDNSPVKRMRRSTPFWLVASAAIFVTSYVTFFLGESLVLSGKLPELWSADWMLRRMQESQLYKPETPSATLTCAKALVQTKGRSMTCSTEILSKFNGFPDDGYVAKVPTGGGQLESSLIELLNRRIDSMIMLFALGKTPFVSVEVARQLPPQTCSFLPVCNEHFIYARNPYLVIGAPFPSGPVVFALPVLSALFGLAALGLFKRLREQKNAA